MVRNSAELGPIIFKIAKMLASNQKLCQLLVNVEAKPFDEEVENPFDLIGKNILLVPEVNKDDFNGQSKVCVVVDQGAINDNKDFKELGLNILVYTPLRSWTINDLALRPFSIIGEIEKTLRGKRLESLGPVKYHGFELISVDDKISGYNMSFSLDVFN
jgi:hypothetical protein